MDAPHGTDRTRGKRPRRMRASDVALVLAGLIVLGGLLWYGSQDPDIGRSELAFYRQMYGPEQYSRNGEEWFIRDFFRDRRDGTFVDVGAYHHEHHSNTYYLETSLGWSGVAVDANGAFAEGYARHRPRTRFVSFFVSDRSDERATLFVPRQNPLMASGDEEFAALGGSTLESHTVPTITLTDLLDAVGIRSVDFLSMDIELAEPRALAGFEIARFRPALVCIEAHRDVRQQVLDYFARAGYVVIGNYLRADQWNLWFRPLAGRASAPPDGGAG